MIKSEVQQSIYSKEKPSNVRDIPKDWIAFAMDNEIDINHCLDFEIEWKKINLTNPTKVVFLIDPICETKIELCCFFDEFTEDVFHFEFGKYIDFNDWLKKGIIQGSGNKIKSNPLIIKCTLNNKTCFSVIKLDESIDYIYYIIYCEKISSINFKTDIYNVPVLVRKERDTELIDFRLFFFNNNFKVSYEWITGNILEVQVKKYA
jgi:DNA-binding XRE family transcriptional regulator